jgi:asparagine synthase (glutamine-hydrolysing)
MCGIFALFCPKCQTMTPDQYLKQIRPVTVEQSKKQQHRGPDWTGIYQTFIDDTCMSMGHERLSIIDVVGGAQPLLSSDKQLALCVNGEIYNYQQLKQSYSDYAYQSKSDCEVILPLYNAFLEGKLNSLVDVCNKLDGDFAFVVFDKKNKRVFAGRDPIGIVPLYYGYTSRGEIVFSSEMKCLENICAHFKPFPPGHYITYDYNSDYSEEPVKYYHPNYQTCPLSTLSADTLLPMIRESLTMAVRKRLMCDVPFGVLLSGGLDSSLIASITSRLVKAEGSKFGHQLRSFSVGMTGSPDLIAAKKVADFIGSDHHEFVFTLEQGIDNLPDVIKHLESYDVTTIRASTPMFIMSRAIKATSVKMVLSGEGADEALGGYLHFHFAPSPEDFHQECKDRISRLHLSDCLRANKATMAWGVEGRFPFLDLDFLELIVPIHPDLKCKYDPEIKQKREKWILRTAFDSTNDPYLPHDILWRQKEQFSDGVGYNWIDGLKAFTESQVSDNQMKMASLVFPHNTPATKEAYYYRSIFQKLFPHNDAALTVQKWIPKISWTGVSSDPSGRSQSVHEKHTNWTNTTTNT